MPGHDAVAAEAAATAAAGMHPGMIPGAMAAGMHPAMMQTSPHAVPAQMNMAAPPPQAVESDDEGAEGYRKGGYHVVQLGEVYNGRYHVVAKLGWGHFSTVWLCHDLHTNCYVAMKVQKSAPHYTEAAYDEIELLAEAAKRATLPEWHATVAGALREIAPRSASGGAPLPPGAPLPSPQNGGIFTGVVQLVDYFEHHGPNGKHVCMVFEVMGPNVLALIKRFNFKGIPLDIVRKVAMHVLIGLDYLHRICGIIHTDLKPENVLVCCPKGVPVNKNGVPLVGHIDPAVVAAQSESQKAARRDKEKADKKSKAHKQKVKRMEDGDIDEGAAPGPLPPQEGDSPTLLKPTPPGPVPPESKINAPPFMKPLLKPTRSDPTLLSSYGDSASDLLRMPYHHARAAHQDAGNTTFAALQPPATAAPTPAADPDSQLSALGAGGVRLDSNLLHEVIGLDLFAHEGVAYKVADLGNACWVHRHFSDDIQTRQYRGPETIISAGYDTSADIWSLACMIFELVTGDYLFDPKASDEYPRDEDHMALFIELLGPVPKALLSRGRRTSTYFNRRGEPRHIKSLRYWGLEDVLKQKYHMDGVEAEALASFLLPMFRLQPEDRATAQQLLTHPWLVGLPASSPWTPAPVPGSQPPAPPPPPEADAAQTPVAAEDPRVVAATAAAAAAAAVAGAPPGAAPTPPTAALGP